MTTLTLNGVDLADAVPEALVVSVARQLAGARRHVSVAVPGRAGSWIFPEEPGDRFLTARIDLEAATFDDRRAAVRDLADWCDLLGPVELIVDDEPDRYHEALLEVAPDVAEWLTHTTDPIELQWRVGPYALAIVQSTEILSITSAPASGTFVPTDLVEALPTVTITPNNGTLTAFAFSLNGDALHWSGSIGADGHVRIDADSATVTEEADADENLTGAGGELPSLSGVSGDFPTIVVGPNEWVFYWSGTATDLTIEIAWRERFR